MLCSLIRYMDMEPVITRMLWTRKPEAPICEALRAGVFEAFQRNILCFEVNRNYFNYSWQELLR